MVLQHRPRSSLLPCYVLVLFNKLATWCTGQQHTILVTLALGILVFAPDAAFKLPIMTSKRNLVGMLMSGYCYEVTEDDEEEAVAHIGDRIQIFEGSKHSRDQQFNRAGRFWKITNTSKYGIGRK